MSQRLLIVGAGGLARETVEAVRACGDQFDLIGLLDDDPLRHGSSVLGTTVLGGTELAYEFPGASVVVATGRPDDYGSRARVVHRLGLPIERYATVIHPTASLGTCVRVGSGSIILANVVATCDVQIGAHVAIMPAVVLTHEDVIENFVTIAAGVRVGGSVVIPQNAYLGAGAVIRESCRVGSRSLIGMGAVVTKDVPSGQTWVGVPAKLKSDSGSHSHGGADAQAIPGRTERAGAETTAVGMNIR